MPHECCEKSMENNGKPRGANGYPKEEKLEKMKVALLKLYAYLKSEIEFSDVRDIADALYARDLLPQEDLEAIQDTGKPRLYGKELLLKKVLVSDDDVFEVFLTKVPSPLKQKMETMDPTLEDKHGFKMAFRGARAEDSSKTVELIENTEYLRQFISQRYFVERINDYMLSNFYFTVQDHNDICNTSGKEQVDLLIKKLNRCPYLKPKDVAEILRKNQLSHVANHLFNNLDPNDLARIPADGFEVRECMRPEQNEKLVTIFKDEAGLTYERTGTGSVVLEFNISCQEDMDKCKVSIKNGDILEFVPQTYSNERLVHLLGGRNVAIQLDVFVRTDPEAQRERKEEKKTKLILRMTETIWHDEDHIERRDETDSPWNLLEENLDLLSEELDCKEAYQLFKRKGLLPRGVEQILRKLKSRREKMEFLIENVTSCAMGFEVLVEYLQKKNRTYCLTELEGAIMRSQLEFTKVFCGTVNFTIGNTEIDSFERKVWMAEEDFTIVEDRKSKAKRICLELLEAAQNGDKIKLQEIITDGNADVNSCDELRETALHKAAMEGHVRAMEMLIRFGANVHAENKEGETPLHKAAEMGHLKAVELLVKAKSKIDAGLHRIETPLHKATAGGHLKCMEYLMKYGAMVEANTSEGDTPLHSAAKAGQAEAIELIVKRGAKLDAGAYWKKTPLHDAAARGHTAAIEKLVKLGSNTDAKDQCDQETAAADSEPMCTSLKKNTPLHEAASHGQVGAMGTLIELGAKMDIFNGVGRTPLQSAARAGKIDATQLLVNLEAKINTVADGPSATLMWAAASGSDKIMDIFHKQKLEIDVVDKDENTPLHHAASHNESKAIDYLVRKGSHLDVRNSQGQTPLHVAAYSGSLNAIERLTIYKAEINITDNEGSTPLHDAAAKGYCRVVDSLVKRGAKMEEKNKVGDTPMHSAAREGHVNVLEVLIGHGGNFDCRNKERRTPLHHAAENGKTDAITFLIKNSANADSRDKIGRTPLHLAVIGVKEESIRALLSCGADTHIYDYSDRKPQDHADDPTIVHMMKMYGEIADPTECYPNSYQRVRLLPGETKYPVKLETVPLIIVSAIMHGPYTSTIHFLRQFGKNAGQKYSLEVTDCISSDVFSVASFANDKSISLELEIPSKAEINQKKQAMLVFSDHRTIHLEEFVIDQEHSYYNITLELKPKEIQTFVIVTRPKKEIFQVGQPGKTILSNVEKEFALTIPPDAFPKETKLSVQMHDPYETEEQQTKVQINDNMRVLASGLYEINIDGKQPSKAIIMQIPLISVTVKCDFVIISAADGKIADASSLEVVTEFPQRLGNNLVFIMNHFSKCAAVPKPIWDKPESRKKVIDKIQGRKTAVFFAMMKTMQHSETRVVIECCKTCDIQKRKKSWLKQGYKEQTPDTSAEHEIANGQRFSIRFSDNIRAREVTKHGQLLFRSWSKNHNRYRVLFDGDKSGQVIIALKKDENETDMAEIKVDLPIVEKTGNVLEEGSLRILGRYLNRSETTNLAASLGMQYTEIYVLSDTNDDETIFCYKVLHTWNFRSEKPLAEREDNFIESLEAIGRSDLAKVVNQVRNKGGPLEEADFQDIELSNKNNQNQGQNQERENM